MAASRSAEEWAELYADLRPLYAAFTDRVLELVETLIDDNELHVWHTYSWALSTSRFESALGTARRAGRRIDDPFRDLGEFAGVSFVGWSPADLPPIADIVEREFEVDYEASVPLNAAREETERIRREPELQLRYPHASYAVSLSESRRSLPEWSAYADLRIELHVLTLSQYAWWCLDIGHLPFHWASSFAPPSREAFARVAELLATVDDVLESEESGIERIAEQYEEVMAGGDLELPLDAHSLEVYLRLAQVVRDLVEIAEAEGMRHDDDDEVPGNFTLEQELLWLLGRQRVRTVAELDALLQDAIDRAPTIYRDLCRLSSEGDFVPFAVRDSVVTFLLVVLGRAEPEVIELLEFGDSIRTALNTLIGNPVQATEPEET
jgi:hypothetical protein